MAKLHITELSYVPQDPDGTPLWIANMSQIVTQQVVTYTTSSPSAAFNSNTKFIRVYSDAKAFLDFGGSPTADVNGIPLPADLPEYFAVSPGSKLAAYDGTS